MARNRTPLAKSAVSGANITHPARFKSRKAPKRQRPIGEPYARMTDEQKEVWQECAESMPWLTQSDRLLLRQVCMLASRLDDPDMGVSAHQALGSLLSKLGATPADVTKVNHGEDDEDEDDEFFGRSH